MFLHHNTLTDRLGNRCEFLQPPFPKRMPSHSTDQRRNSRRRGFTLFEITISLVLVTFGVISVLLIFPAGIKQQQLSRFKILASVKAMEMMDSFTGSVEYTRSMDPEVPEPWESNNYAYSSTRFDLESRLCNWHHGLLPVPAEIARRLDSNGDEIQQILGEGGSLYYSQPMANTNLDERWMAKAMPNDALKVVCAISGYAQNNALPSLPWKEWPYRAPYPSPPVAAYLDDASMQSVKNTPTTGYNNNRMYSWEWWFGGTVGKTEQVVPPLVDPWLRNLYVAAEACNTNVHTPANRKAYIESALKYGEQTFLNNIKASLPSPVTVGYLDEFNTYFRPNPATDNAMLDVLGKDYDLAFAALCKSAEMDPADAMVPYPGPQITNKIKLRMDVVLRVQCMRFLAHSMMTISVKNKLRDYDNNDAVVDTKVIDGKIVTPGLLRYYHERCLAMVMRYAASFPYDWGAPRPAQRSIMMDHPLLEWDLFSSPRSGRIAGTTVPAAMWKPLAAQPVSNLGPAASYSGSYNTAGTYNRELPPFPNWDMPMPNTFWGNPAHFTLTKPFSPKERCRQIVFWAVDWQSYEDAETAPSASMDASRAPLMGPRNPAGTFSARSLNQRWSAKETYQLMNPEYRLNFTKDISSLSTGSDITALSNLNVGEQIPGSLKNAPFLNGIYGADRNFNGLLDRGPVSRSVRLRATLIARFNYYDPRLPLSLR